MKYIRFLISILLIALLLPIFILVFIAIKLSSKGPVFYWSRRIGKDKKVFWMPKLRTMRVETPQLATHLLDDADSYLTPIGNILRKYSIDEIPQIYSILKGDMNFIGPRPALFNQDDLVELRSKEGLISETPGLTGWAQINGRDNITIEEKVKFEKEYKQRQSFSFDLYIIWRTFVKVIKKDGVIH